MAEFLGRSCFIGCRLEGQRSKVYNYILGESGPSESGPGPPGPSPTGANLPKQPPDSGGPSIAPTPPQNIDKSGI